MTLSVVAAVAAPHRPRPIIIGSGDLGTSVFAAKTFSTGETILTFQGPLITFGQAVAKGDLESYALQIGPESYLDLTTPGCYVNHSCEPNAGIIRGRELVAVRRIAPGEEIRYDYSTTMDEDHWTMKCFCGTSACRETIKDFKYLPPHLQQKYLHQEIVQPFIASQVRHIRAKATDLLPLLQAS